MTRSAQDFLAEIETLPDEWALVMLDRSLRSGEQSVRDLIATARNFSDRVQWLVVIADTRATSTVQSLIRRAWYRADLPTPTLGRRLQTPEGPVVAVCSTDYHRFATATTATAAQRDLLSSVGWHVLVLSEKKVLAASASELAEYLRAEHLQHLATAGLGRPRDVKRA